MGLADQGQLRARGVLAALLATCLTGCGGSAIKKDQRRLENMCAVVATTVLNEEQARCVAKIYGIKEKKRCPVVVDRPEGYGVPVFRVVESCNGIAAVVAESGGRVLALQLGDEVVVD